MALRLLEVKVPAERMRDIPELLEDSRFIQSWTTGVSPDHGVVHVLTRAEDTESLSDLFLTRFGSHDGFRLVLLQVEATLPAVEEPPAREPDSGVEREVQAPGPKRISREELYEDVNQASGLSLVYLIMVALSSVVAAVGLVRGDVALVIGAMVIAPLLGPNIGLSLGSTLGDLELVRRSLKALGAGVATAAAISFLLGALFTVDPLAPELVARTQAGVGDIVIALSAGSAGTLAFTSGVPAVVVGVMVAVALLPPLVAAGLLAGAGYGHASLGALMLLVTNVTCINLAAVATFLAQRVRPRLWWEADRAKKATRVAVTLWVSMLLVLLVLIWLRHIRAV